jgi:hypothetical protein
VQERSKAPNGAVRTESSSAFAALGHPVRLLLLGRSPRWAELQELDEVGTTGQLYHHLKQLVAVSWLQNAGRGRYAVLGNRVVPLLVLLAATHPEVG